MKKNKRPSVRLRVSQGPSTKARKVVFTPPSSECTGRRLSLRKLAQERPFHHGYRNPSPDRSPGAVPLVRIPAVPDSTSRITLRELCQIFLQSKA